MVNPGVVIGFYLGGDFAIRNISMATIIICVFFLFESRQIQNLQLKLRKESGLIVILSFFVKKLPSRLIFYKAYNMDEEDKYSPCEF